MRNAGSVNAPEVQKKHWKNCFCAQSIKIFAMKSFLSQLFANGRWHQELGLVETTADDEHSVGQIEQYVRINCDERPLALARNHNRAAWLRREAPVAVRR